MAVKMAEGVEDVELAKDTDELKAPAETLGKKEVEEVVLVAGAVIITFELVTICCATLTSTGEDLVCCLVFCCSTVCDSTLATLLLPELLEDLDSRFRFRGDFAFAY